MTTVTDADREAAAAIAVLPEMRDLILSGHADHHAEPFARHAARARLEGAEIMREAAAVEADDAYGYGDCCLDTLGDTATAIRNIDPAAILEAHTRAKAMDELAEADAELLDDIAPAPPVG